MHSSLAPQMDPFDAKFTAAFEQQTASSGSKSQFLNGASHKRPSGGSGGGGASSTTATASTESSGEKTISFRKGNDLESFEALSSLFANGLFTDLVICCSGKMFKCHRVVMAAASIYIRDALSAFYNNDAEANTGCNHCNTVMILPKDVKMTDMEAILRFVYDGHVEVRVDSIESFLKSARMLNIKGLSNVNIVFNNGSSIIDDPINEAIEESTVTRKNNGYSKSHLLTNGHGGINSPPPSPPSLNSSLASLKALAASHTNSPVSLPNGNHNKHLNGLSGYRNSGSHKQRDNSPLRNSEQASAGATTSLLSQNLTPAHQSSTPKSIFSSANLFNSLQHYNSAANTIVPPSGGSRRKQKFPTNIPQAFLQDMQPLAAFYNLFNQEEEEEEEVDDSGEEKKLVVKQTDDSSNDCSTTGDNLSTASMETSKHGSLPFGMPLGSSFNPQIPCMIEVEADPTNFPTYCHEINDNANTLLQSVNKRRRHFKSGFPATENIFNNKKLKLPYSSANVASPNTDISIKPSSPLMPTTSTTPQPTELLTKKHGLRTNLPNDKPLFTAYSTVKTAAGANPSAASPSSSSSTSASGSWAGNKWKCDICNKYYGNKQTLKEHMDYFHSNREEQIYICNICNKEYTWRKSLMKHYRDIHQMRNTPALAEINRQLAALASAKVRTAVASSAPVSSSMSQDSNSNSLQSFVSIANSTNRKGNNANKSECAKSDIDLDDNQENVDAVPEEDDGEDSNEEVELEVSSNGGNHGDLHEESLSVSGDSKEDTKLEEKFSNGSSNSLQHELSDTSSNPAASQSPVSLPAS